MIHTVEARELTELLHMLPAGSWRAESPSPMAGVRIDLVTPDSRECRAGAMFVAIAGTRQDGNAYIPAAVRAGASCIVAETQHSEVGTVPLIVTPNPRQFLSLVAQAFFDFPARRMKMIGITGTSGKTSTAYMVRRLLQGAGIKSVMIGTTGYVMPDGESFPPDTLPATTPESFALNWYLDHAATAGARVAVVEVSSFALAFERVFGMRFDCGVFTNFSQDHMGYHGSMEAYLVAKQRLFASLDDSAVAVLNADDPAFDAFRKAATRAHIATFSLNGDADLCGRNVQSQEGTTTFDVRSSDGDEAHVVLAVGPAFQASNCLAAIGAVRVVLPSSSLSALTYTLAEPLYIPGRYERIDCGQPFEVIVDYAHTPEEFAALFGAVGPSIRGDMIAVFGSVGADDREKRPIMARIAEHACRWSFVTVEDPRREDASLAVHDIVAGFLERRFTVLEDRREAIRQAIAAAGPGDAVLILGRGHETVMYYEREDVTLDDRQEARRALQALGYSGASDLRESAGGTHGS